MARVAETSPVNAPTIAMRVLSTAGTHDASPSLTTNTPTGFAARRNSASPDLVLPRTLATGTMVTPSTVSYRPRRLLPTCYLTSDEGKADLKTLGGLSTATAGVILRELIGFQDQGADAFFGEPEFESKDLLQVTPEGKGLISLVELPNLQDRPAVFSTFLMWLLADLFHDLPEVGDADRPKLVFFFDEAHLLFNDASEAFLDQIAQTVRLIRSKAVGVFFVTQSPTDVPDDVLAQLGSRVQHQLRAHTPNDAKALRATVNTYPTSEYDDLGEVITSLGIGEAIVTVMNERGAPTPVAWTRLRAPESLMGPAEATAMQQAVEASPRHAKYAETIDRESAREKLAAKLEEGARKAQEDAEYAEQARQAKLDKAEQAKLTRRPRRRRTTAAWSRTSSSPVPSRTSCAPPPARSPAACSAPAGAEGRRSPGNAPEWCFRAYIWAPERQ